MLFRGLGVRISTLWTAALAGMLVAFGAPATGTASGINSLPDRDQLQLASVHAAVAALPSATLLYDKAGDHTAPIASITKLMTAMVVLDSEAPLGEWLTILEREQKPPANAYSRIRIGSEATRSDLLRITLMSSENLAADVLARHHPGGRAAFIAAMNAKAVALGMHQTHFVDPSGLWVENRSSAHDLVKMVAAAYAYPEIREMSTTPRHRVNFRGPRYSLDYANTNPLVHSSRWDIGLSKTGYLTEAGRCLVMVTEVEGEPLVLVLLDSLGSRTPLGDSGRIRRWLETGTGGAVAGAALDYERSRSAILATSASGD